VTRMCSNNTLTMSIYSSICSRFRTWLPPFRMVLFVMSWFIIDGNVSKGHFTFGVETHLVGYLDQQMGPCFVNGLTVGPLSVKPFDPF
jgi:hypothetical protein